MGRRELAIWSEMISDGVMGLEHAGALEPRRPIICSFLFGSPELYSWVDGNPRLRMTRTEVTDDPARIAEHAAMVSVNTALQVDLSDQAGASHIGERLYYGAAGAWRAGCAGAVKGHSPSLEPSNGAYGLRRQATAANSRSTSPSTVR
jgi:acyl-CoA hydrolase